MAPAPLPPHERQWRHPSELAPTAADVETASTGRGLIVASGAAAAMLAAVMVIALTPPRSSSPSAVSATTIAATSQQQQGNIDRIIPDRPQGIVRLNRDSVTCDGALNRADATPEIVADDFDVAKRTPESAEAIVLLTDSHACTITWSQIERVAAPDGAVVISRDGEMIGVFADGEFIVLVD